jgi:hypothetical protein
MIARTTQHAGHRESERAFRVGREMPAIDWIFDPLPASGAVHGGLAQAQVFENTIDSFVREVLQNARDQRVSNEPVRVRFLLEELADADLDEFLNAIQWSALREHLDAVAAADQITISPRIRANLHELDNHGRLRLMRIDDFGTKGLTGGEDESDSNFNALCRHTLVTSGGRRESGGSFGLGKSVLWRFSGVSTVLFASTLSDPPMRLRFFGRTLLTYHKTPSGDWEGSGWLGATQQRVNGSRAVSVFDAEAQALTDAARLAREDTTPGTSILVLSFDDPTRETDPEVPDLCREIVESTARWFWPALQAGQLEVAVEGRVGAGTVYSASADITDEIRPFVKAQEAAAADDARVGEPGQVAERVVGLNVPAQRPEQVRDPLASAKASGRLRLRLAETDETAHANTVALQRGTGMVVQYFVPRRRSIAEQAFHASLTMGLAHGADASDKAAEQFLRAAEPVAHQSWVSTTDRIHAEYQLGASKGLRDFEEEIALSIADMLREPPPDSAKGPEALRRLFPIPGIGGGSVTREPFRLTNAVAVLHDDRWRFSGSYSRSSDTPDAWRFRVALELDQEDGTAGERIAIESLVALAGKTVGPASDGSWMVEVPEGTNEVEFSGVAGRPSEIPVRGFARARIRLNVRPSATAAQ